MLYLLGGAKPGGGGPPAGNPGGNPPNPGGGATSIVSLSFLKRWAHVYLLCQSLERQGSLQEILVEVRQYLQQAPKNISSISKLHRDHGHTANPTGAPRPAGRAIPAPVARDEAIPPPGALAPNRAAGSAGGGDSTEREMI
jgi:hypothetical protein